MRALRNWDRRDWIALGVIAAAVLLTLVVGLAQLPVQIWDEARLAINAIEITNRGVLLVPTFHGELDLWNPKPPLATWLSALSMRLFGINELALRLPSLAAAIATTFLVYGFTLRATASRATGVLAALFLLGTGGYAEVHVARTADADSLLVFFLTATAFALFRALEELEARRNSAWFMLSASLFACAMLTKGAAAFLVLPGYAVAIIALRKAKAVLSSPAAWAGSVFVLLVAVLYSSAAEVAHPGFLMHVWRMDGAGRFAAVSDAHSGPAYYYLKELFRPWQYWTLKGLDDILYNGSAFPWSLSALLLAPLAFISNDARARRAAIFCLATLAGFIIAISAAATKLSWYVAPAFPLIAVVCAIEVRMLALATESSPSLKLLGRATVPAAFAAAFVCIGLGVAKNREENASSAWSRDERLPAFLQNLPEGLTSHGKIAVISDAQWDIPAIHGERFQGRLMDDAPTEFYVAALRGRGADVQLVPGLAQTGDAQLIIGCGLQRRGDNVLLRRGECAAMTP